jgi:drug/metabolite transporter (DMT)-like permease
MSPDVALVALPSIAAFLYVFSALLIKRSSDYGVGVWRATFVTNFIVASVCSFLWLLGGHDQPWTMYWQPGIIAVLFLLGQTLQFLALDRGDVSVAVPLFSTKVVLVAFLSTKLLNDTITPKLWAAAALSVLAVTFLNMKAEGKAPKNIGLTLIGGIGGSVCFAFFDVLVQKWSPVWGVGRLLPALFWMGALLSFSLVPFFKAPLSAIPRPAWPWLIGGSALLGTQSAIFVSAFALFGKATIANIVYSARGLWSVVLIWLIGHWFSNLEQHLGIKVLRWRLVGALCMMGAIALVVIH